MQDHIIVQNAGPLSGSVELSGAKNAALPIIIALILTPGTSRLRRVPALQDVSVLIELLTLLGARVTFDRKVHELVVDTSRLAPAPLPAQIMGKMRASVLAMGPLLARFGWAEVAFPGGDAIGARPIDLHLKAFAAMGAEIDVTPERVRARAKKLSPCHVVLDYPSVGATENILMAAVLVPGQSRIVNAALEPEILDLIAVLSKMGAEIEVLAPATIVVQGVAELQPCEHDLLLDRLEAGTLLLAAAMTGGSIEVPEIRAETLELFLKKLMDMGHRVTLGPDGRGVRLEATVEPRAISFKTMPYPGFPTDLQAPMTAALCRAAGVSRVTETVFENRMHHVPELIKMGALIGVQCGTATVTGVDRLIGAAVAANDIRVAAALILAGLTADDRTVITGLSHLERGYEGLDQKLQALGACLEVVRIEPL
ncbi:MAG: UDP-N-acetylglucosamine 1-carboxyvinyltransferase [Candidatus Dependentiae bacterium]|nr:UDP-N-acetylglucosamine 1-carboxyvinyltransferase [Candidatus Dependentiae bacterium]